MWLDFFITNFNSACRFNYLYIRPCCSLHISFHSIYRFVLFLFIFFFSLFNFVYASNIIIWWCMYVLMGEWGACVCILCLVWLIYNLRPFLKIWLVLIRTVLLLISFEMFTCCWCIWLQPLFPRWQRVLRVHQVREDGQLSGSPWMWWLIFCCSVRVLKPQLRYVQRCRWRSCSWLT